jgi:DNA-binding NarL/FixJ family response regulator/multidrug resistance efflux pump
MIRILLVDDQKTIREALKIMLTTEPDFNVVGTAEDGYGAIEQAKILQPDVILLDLEMPGLDGLSAIEAILENSIGTKILVFSNHDDEECVLKSLRAGAMGYLHKNTPAGELKDAIRFVYRGYAQIGPGLFDRIMPLALETHPLVPPANSTGTIELLKSENLVLSNLNLQQSGQIVPSNFKSGELVGLSSIQAEGDRDFGLRQVLALSLVAVGLTAAVYSVRQHLREPLPSLSQSEQLQQLTGTEFNGKVEPAHKFKITATTPSVVEEIYIKIGDRVKAGQPLIALRNPESDRAREQARLSQQASIQQQQLALQQVQVSQQQILELQQKIDSFQASIAPLNAQIAQANQRVALARSNADKLPMRQRQDSVERAQTLYQRAQARAQRYQKLYKQGVIAKDELEQVQADANLAKADLVVAQQAATAAAKLDLAQQEQSSLQYRVSLNDRSQELQQFKNQLQVAQLQYKQASDRLNLLRQQESELTKNQNIPEKLLVKATNPGVIIELPLNVGDQIYTGNPLVGLAQMKQLKVEVPVNARLINALDRERIAVVKLGVGAAAREFPAKVTTINPIPSEDLNYKVEVQFENNTDTLLVGQAAAVYFPNN